MIIVIVGFIVLNFKLLFLIKNFLFLINTIPNFITLDYRSILILNCLIYYNKILFDN